MEFHVAPTSDCRLGRLRRNGGWDLVAELRTANLTDFDRVLGQIRAIDGSSASGDVPSGADDGSETAGTEVATTIAWAAPDGMNPSGIAVSPAGDRVAMAFSTPPGLEGVPSELVVYDVAAGAEAWRVAIDGAGLAGLDTMVFLEDRVVEFRRGFESPLRPTVRRLPYCSQAGSTSSSCDVGEFPAICCIMTLMSHPVLS